MRIEQLKVEFQEVVFKEEISCRQTSRVKWLKEADNYTGFLHIFFSGRKKKNDNSTRLIGGVDSLTKEVMEEEILTYFQNLCFKKPWRHASFSRREGKSLTSEKATWMERLFSIGEITEAIFPLRRIKLLAQMDALWVFQECREKDDFVIVIEDFHKHEKASNALNSTFVSFISKKNGANKISDGPLAL